MKDLFSAQSKGYAQYRPAYPKLLYRHILAQASGRESAWDCATGNGQAAIALSPHFQQVYATDLSAKQLAEATPAPNVHYRQAPAEDSGLPDASIDLITVAQALHWFGFERFFGEARRVLRPGGLLAAWGYDLLRFDDAELDAELRLFYQGETAPYWDAARSHIDDRYARIPFPFTLLPSPDFRIEISWTLADLAGFLDTWSAVQTCICTTGRNPVAIFSKKLANRFPVEQRWAGHFPVFLKMGHWGA